MKKILVVDDEPDALYLAEFWLGKQGFDVATASSGEEAIEAFQRDRPHVLVTDYMMPRVSGLDLCRRVRAVEGEPRTPIIMVSAVVHPPSNEERLYDAFLSKPMYFERLVEEIDRLLDN
jgi:two-component system response regulator VicR